LEEREKREKWSNGVSRPGHFKRERGKLAKRKPSAMTAEKRRREKKLHPILRDLRGENITRKKGEGRSRSCDYLRRRAGKKRGRKKGKLGHGEAVTPGKRSSVPNVFRGKRERRMALIGRGNWSPGLLSVLERGKMDPSKKRGGRPG